MANRYDIVHIDFQASARGANAAIESLRQEAEKSNGKLQEMRDTLDSMKKSGASDEAIAGIRAEMNVEKRRYDQLVKGQNELIKGMRVLDQGVKMFNDGSLSQMNAAFQKAVNNAAKLAQSKMDAGTQTWREMGAIMQETEQNYARMQRDTDQLIQVIRNGGTVFRGTLEQEKKGIQELMSLVPYMGSEYQKLEGQLQVVTTKLDQMTTAERQMKGEIVTANDARRVAYQLTEEGAAAAKREAEAAEQTIAASKKRIAVLEDERKKREETARATAEAVAKRNEDLAMQDDIILGIEKEIAADERKSKRKRKTAADAKQTAEDMAQSVETEKAELERLQDTTKAAEEKVKRLEGELSKLGETDPIKPKVDTSEIERLNAELKEAQRVLGNASAYEKLAQAKLEGMRTANSAQEATLRSKEAELKKFSDATSELQERRSELDWAIEPFSRRHRHGNNHFDVHDIEHQRIALEKLDEAFRRLRDDEYFKNASLSRQYELLGTSAFGFSDAERQFGSYERAIRSLGVALEETGAKARLIFQGAGVDKSFQGVEFLDGYVSRRKEIRQLNSEIKNALGDTDIDALAREVEAERIIFNKRTAELQEQEKEVIRWGKLREEYADKAAAAEKRLNEAQQQSIQPTQQQTDATQQQDAEIKKLIDDIKTLDGTIGELKKKRDELTASQKQGADAAKKDGEAIKMTAEEAKAALDKMNAKSTVKIKGDQGLELSNPEQLQGRIIAHIKAAYQNPKDAKNNSGGFQTKNRNQLQKVAEGIADEYQLFTDDGKRDIRAAMDVLSRVTKGKSGGYVKGGAFDETNGILRLDIDKDAQQSYIKNRQELLNISKGVTQATKEQTQATNGQTEAIKKQQEEESKLIQLQKELKQAMTDAGYAGKSPDQIDVFASLNRSARTGFANQIGTSNTWKHRFGADSSMQEWVEGHAKTLSDRDSYFTALSKETIKDSLSGYLTKDKTLTDVKDMQAEWRKVASSFVNNPATNSGYYMDAVNYIDRLVEKTVQLKEIQEKRLAVQNQQAIVDGLKQEAESTENVTRAAQSSAETAKQETELTQQLTSAKKEYTEAKKAEEEQLKKVNDVTEKYNKKQQEANKLDEELTKGSAEKNAKLEDAKKTREKMLDDQEKNIELNQKAQGELQETNDKIAEQGNIIREAQTKRAQAQTNNIKATEDAIRKLREENAAIDVNSKEWSDNAREIQRLEDALGKMKNQAALQMMTERMERVPQLSTAALTETKRFWEGMVAGAERGSKELAEYEANLKTITEEEQKRQRATLEASAKRLSGNLGELSASEMRQAIDDAKKLQSTYRQTSQEAQQMAKNIVGAEEYSKKYGVEAERQARKEAEATRQQEEQERQLLLTMRQRLNSMKTLSADALAETRKYWEAQRNGAEEGSAAFKKAELAMQALNKEQARRTAANNERLAARLNGDLGNLSEAEIREAIEAGKQLAQSYKSTSTEAQQMAQKIVAAEEHIKQYGLEAQRAAQKQAAIDTQMRERMNNLTTLSSSALTETKKYWEDMMRTQGLAEQKLSSYRIQLEKLIAEENRRKEVQAERVIGDMGNFSDNEIRKAVQAFEQLRDVQKHGSDEWNYYNQRVQEGKKYLDEWAKVDSVIKFEEQMAKLPQLSDSALQETKKFWETMVAGADKGSSELREYEAHLEKVKQEESERRQLSLEQQAQSITGLWPRYNDMSEKDIRRAIEATKELLQTVKMGDDEYDQYALAIVRAEKHLKDYGIEAERARAKLSETNYLYESQLHGSAKLSDTALKAQEQYWKRLIDDPKTASESLAQYQANLDRVHELQRQMAETAGKEAFAFFEQGRDKDSSAQEIEEQVKNLKAYRDSLPRETQADVIQRINEYIRKTGEAAKVASGQTMALKNALRIGSAAGGENFKGTVEQLTQAKKTLEELQQKAVKGGYAWRRMQEGIDNINLELRRTGFISKEVQAVLDKPKGRSFNDLKLAVEQGRQKLQAMDRTTKEGQKAFDELAKKVKAADIEMKSLGNSSKGTASSFDKAWSRLKTYIGLYVSAAVAMQKLTGTMGDLMELSDKMGEVRKTTGFTAEEVGRLSDELKKMDTRTALTGLMDLSAAAGQLGLNTEEDVLGFTEAANKLMVALPEMGREGATEMLKVALATGEIDKIRKQMSQGIIEGSSATAVAMEKVGSTIDRLRATSASTAPAITDFVKRVGAVGAQSGITIDQVAALGSTVDALGMRVEMSATALSRMMPAIKNNAFDIAKILGVTPNTIRELYDTGQGMEVILMILQHIKDSNMSDADSIEKMLGMAGMSEVMKELNQQGARAGIVFGGLSQNVDELRRQLGVAKEAYEENVAIQQEYDKMNETTAAKWARLKNELEEAFVGDQAQRWLGGIIDLLRNLVNVISGNVTPALKGLNVAVWTAGAYFATWRLGIGKLVVEGFGLLTKGLLGVKAAIMAVVTAHGRAGLMTSITKAIGITKMYVAANLTLAFSHNEAAKAAARQTLASNALGKAMGALKANVVMGVIAAIGVLAYKMHEWNEKAKESAREAAKLQAELDKQDKNVGKLTDSIGKARVKMEDANKEVAKARAELDAAKKANDGTTEAVNRLTKAEANLLEKEGAKKTMMASHKQLIADFNNQYGKYLGFMLSEVSSNMELARARDLVNSKLRETLTLKRQEAAIERVEKEKGGARDKAYENLDNSIAGANGYVVVNGRKRTPDPTQKPRIMAELAKAANSAKDRNAFIAQAKKIFKDNNYPVLQTVIDQAANYYDEVQNVRIATENVINQNKGEQAAARQISQGDLVRQANAGFSNYNGLVKRYRNSKGDERARNAAALLQQIDTMEDIKANASSYYDMSNPKEAALYRKQFQQLNTWKGYDRNALLREAGRYYTPRKRLEEGANGNFTPSNSYTSGNTSSNVWGNEVDATSTDYSTWDVNELVERRKQMNRFKNVLKPGIEVRKVLAEDRALMKAIDEKRVGEDWQSVLNWYNAERKKIQQELKSERFSTNTGNWRDEKNGKGRRNPLLESDYALAELDRYYSRRKEALEKARSEENISEELFNRQSEMLEQEHLERRSKLRGTFTGEVSKAETKAFRKWWENLEKMNELDDVPWATVESEWSKATAAQIGRNNLKMQQDMTQLESITMKHVNQIAKIIAKERPYDGIAENLKANLTNLDILFADLGTVTKKQLEDGSLTKELNNRLSFLLGEAEHAYTLTAEQLMADMRDKGFGSLADAIANDKNADDLKQRLLSQLRTVYDAVQDAIKKEASQIKKQVEIQWNDTTMPDGRSQKQTFEATLSTLGLQEDQVKRANQLIGAGYASERVADRLAIKQMQIRLAMQTQYYAMTRKIGEERIRQLEAAGKYEDAEHLKKSLNLALSEEQKKLDEQRVAIANQLEETQNRLYTSLREWADLFASSMQSVFEASHAGDASYYNERAKLDLTGKGGPGAGTYVIIDNEGTSDARAHYEYLDERQALEREREIERENALADAWKKVMDDINMKISETITDQMNAMLQNASVDANTNAVVKNTEAIIGMTEALGGQGSGSNVTTDTSLLNMEPGGAPGYGGYDENNPDTWPRAMRKRAGLPVDENAHDHTGGAGGVSPVFLDPANAGGINWIYEKGAEAAESSAERQIAAMNKVEEVNSRSFHKQVQTTVDANEKTKTSTQSMYAKMTQAMNLYGTAYQAMSNDNLSTSQKFQMIALQAAGSGAMAALTANLSESEGSAMASMPGVLGKIMQELGPIAGPIAYAAFTALMGGLMGMAMSKVSKAKSQIASVTGASIGAGRLATGMLTYAEGNVNEFTDPSTLTPGRQYNVDAADGRTYRARYMGRNAKTHITNGPEFHLSGEKGREMIIDADTTRQITLNERDIWHTIQTLSTGRRMPGRRMVGRGMAAFADGNVEDFEEMMGGYDIAMNGTGGRDLEAMQASLDRNSAVQEALLERLNQPIVAQNIWHGPDGIPSMYNKMQKEAQRHGEKYL